MKKLLAIACVLFLFSCKNEETKGKFTVTGKVENAPDEKIYLEEVYFNGKPPTTIDTAEIKNKNFSINGIGQQEGMYRLRLENGSSYIFINDKPDITTTIDAADQSFTTAKFNTPANQSLYKFIGLLASSQIKLQAAGNNYNSLKDSKANDSLIKISANDVKQLSDQYTKFLLTYIDTAASPVVALFVLGYTQGIDPQLVDKSVASLEKKFPKHRVLNDLIAQYRQERTQAANKTAAIAPGSIAPEITMNDTEDKPFSISSLKGKYVLIDFWASWCGPCREENPNVVQAYKKFKDKNFTIVGVSLDKNKSEWLQAIKQDGLEWKQISDLKFWNSAAVPLYNLESIPFNVLIDPDGKIIATALRGPDLENKLAEVLK